MYKEEAEEMLAAASPWPWNHRLEPRGDGPGVYKVGNGARDLALIADTVFEDEQEANAVLLGFAPATLAALILAVEALDREERLRTHARACHDCNQGTCREVGQLQTNADITRANALYAWSEL